MTEPSSQLNCGHLCDLAAGYESDRPVFIDTGGGPRPAVYGSQIDPVNGNPATLLRSWGLGPAPTEPVWVLEWGAPPGTAPLPSTTAHRGEAGARDRIAAVTAEWGLDAATAVETTQPGGMVLGHLEGGLTWMLRTLEVLP